MRGLPSTGCIPRVTTTPAVLGPTSPVLGSGAVTSALTPRTGKLVERPRAELRNMSIRRATRTTLHHTWSLTSTKER